jgi:hypothetical protein
MLPGNLLISRCAEERASDGPDPPPEEEISDDSRAPGKKISAL